MSSMDAGALKRQTSAAKRLSFSSSSHAVSVHHDPVPVDGGQVLIRGRVTGGTYCGSDQRSYCDRININYGLESYFVPEGEGREIESARNRGKVAIVAAVTPAGRAAIKRLIVDGKSVYEEPMF